MSTTQKTCFWAFLSISNLTFVYISPSLENTLQSGYSILGTCFYDYLHAAEYSPAKRDISRSIEQQDLLGSVTRCRFRNIFSSRPLLGPGRKISMTMPQPSEHERQKGQNVSSPRSPILPAQTRSPHSYFSSADPVTTTQTNQLRHLSISVNTEDEEYLVMDITLNVLCDGVVLGIFHPIDDEQKEYVCGQTGYSVQEIDKWAQCVRYLSEQDRFLGHSRNLSDIPLTPNTPQSPSYKAVVPNPLAASLSLSPSYSSYNRVFFILDSDTLSPLLCWPEDSFCKLTGAQHAPPSGSRGVLEHHLKPEDLRKIKEHLAKAPPIDGRLCTQSYSGKHGVIHMDGSLQYIQCILIPYGSITFACFQPIVPLLSNFTAQQPLQLSLPPGKRHHSQLNEKVLDNKPASSYTPLISTSNVSHLLSSSHPTTSEMPLTPCSPSVQRTSQLPCPGPTSGELSRLYPYYPRNSHNRASLPALPTLRNEVADFNFNTNRRASEPHTTFARPRDKINPSMSSSSLCQIPENQEPTPSSPKKRTFHEPNSATCKTHGKKNRSEHEDLRVRVLGRNHSESDIFMPMDHLGIHRRHSSPAPQRDLIQSKASLPPISQLVFPQPPHPNVGLAYSLSQLPPTSHGMTTPVGAHSQSSSQFRPLTPGHHNPPVIQGYTMTRGGIPISFLHSTTGIQKRCESCNTSQSPEWRRGPTGHKTLCNACGLRYSRSIARAGKQQQKTNVTTTSSVNVNTPRPITNFSESSTTRLPPNTGTQSTSKANPFIEHSSTHQYVTSNPTYSRTSHISSSLPSSSGNIRESR